MPYSSGIYTRVDNSFSNPVVGTTISPTHADTYFDDIDAALNAYYGTSTTSLAIGTGSKVFTTQSGKLFSAGRFVVAVSAADSANYMFGQVTSYSSTTLTVNVTLTGGSGTLADWTIYLAGGQGATGATGATGEVPTVHFNFDNATADADPGSGDFRLNHATPASATAAYFDNNERGGTAVSAWLDTFDDSGNSTLRGYLHLLDPATPTTFYIFSVSGSVTDGTGYRKVTIAYVAGAGSFTNGNKTAVAFYTRGPSGAGDVAGPASSTDNAVARFDSTTGKVLQDSGVIIDDSNNVTGVAALTATTVNIGNADTTLARTGAGDISVEGNAIYRASGTDVAIADGGTGQSTAKLAVSSSGLNLEQTTTGPNNVYQILATDHHVVTSTAFTASRTWTLPGANSVNGGHRVTVSDLANTVTSSNTLIIARNGSDTIVSQGTTVTSLTFSAAGAVATFVSDGSSKWTLESIKHPTIVTTYASGSGTHTTRVGVRQLRVRMCGGGGGGGGSGTSPAAATAGGNTTFGASLTANGGALGTTGTNSSSAGGTATGGDINIGGGTSGISTTGSSSFGGAGGLTHLGNSGPATVPGFAAGAAGVGPGAAGAGASSGATANSGGGGGGGGFLEKLIENPATTYAYAVGAAGSAGGAGTGGAAGGAGAAGVIVVEEEF